MAEKFSLNDVNPEEFTIRECQIAGDKCYLVFPNFIGVKWNEQNLKYRSVIFNEHGEPVSLGFKKFFNFGEQPNLVPDPTDLKGTVIPEKIDGSLLIISWYKGELVIRTRGTVDARILDNGFEIDYLVEKYPKVFNQIYYNSGMSWLFEWVSTENRIVLQYPDTPDIYMVGVIDHADYTYLSQNDVDELARILKVKRPRLYSFNTLTNLINAVKEFKGVEGVCVYYNHGQDIKKLKSLDYLAKHAFKSEMSNRNVLDLFIAKGYPKFGEFYSQIEQEFDFEIAEYARPFISRVCDAYKEWQEIYSHMLDFVNKIKHLPRKDAAQIVLNSYGQTGRSGVVFRILDGKVPDETTVKKILEQLMRK